MVYYRYYLNIERRDARNPFDVFLLFWRVSVILFTRFVELRNFALRTYWVTLCTDCHFLAAAWGIVIFSFLSNSMANVTLSMLFMPRADSLDVDVI